MMLEFSKPIPCTTPLGDAYGIYATDSGMFENDTWTCVLKNGGDVKHFTTNEIRISHNGTFDIKKKDNGDNAR
jgi:hypothetical protein